MNGLHVLMVYDDTKTNSMSGTQRAVLAGQTVRDYLESKCAAGPDGTKDYRIWPATVMDVSGEAKPWQGAFTKPRTLTAVENGKNVPIIWMYLSDGKSSEVKLIGPGDTLDSVLATLKKYGG